MAKPTTGRRSTSDPDGAAPQNRAQAGWIRHAWEDEGWRRGRLPAGFARKARPGCGDRWRRGRPDMRRRNRHRCCNGSPCHGSRRPPHARTAGMLLRSLDGMTFAMGMVFGNGGGCRLRLSRKSRPARHTRMGEHEDEGQADREKHAHGVQIDLPLAGRSSGRSGWGFPRRTNATGCRADKCRPGHDRFKA